MNTHGGMLTHMPPCVLTLSVKHIIKLTPSITLPWKHHIISHTQHVNAYPASCTSVLQLTSKRLEVQFMKANGNTEAKREKNITSTFLFFSAAVAFAARASAARAITLGDMSLW